MSRRRSRAGRAVTAAVVLCAIAAAGVVGVVAFLGRTTAGATEPERCTATLDGTRWYLSIEQADNAALLAGAALRRHLPARAVTIAVATALQESKLSNLDHGDRDSIGLFQQRPSQGWGTVDQIMDPRYSTKKFYDGLVKVDGYETLEITKAAQAVQRSGFPEAYAQHETRARAWASALTGYSAGALTCRTASPVAPSPAAIARRVKQDLGDLPVTRVDDAYLGTRIDARALGSTSERARSAWAVAQWSVAVSAGLGITVVDVADQRWTSATSTWTTREGERKLTSGLVEINRAD